MLLIFFIIVSIWITIDIVFKDLSTPGKLQIEELVVNDSEIIAEYNATNNNKLIAYNVVKVNLTMRITEKRKPVFDKYDELWLTYYAFGIRYQNQSGRYCSHISLPSCLRETEVDMSEVEEFFNNAVQNYSSGDWNGDWINGEDIKGRYSYYNYKPNQEQDLTGLLFFIIPKEITEIEILYGGNYSVKVNI